MDTGHLVPIGDMSITASDGTELEASCDIALAWKWAPIEIDATHGVGTWAGMSYGEQCRKVRDALTFLHCSWNAHLHPHLPHQ